MIHIGKLIILETRVDIDRNRNNFYSQISVLIKFGEVSNKELQDCCIQENASESDIQNQEGWNSLKDTTRDERMTMFFNTFSPVLTAVKDNEWGVIDQYRQKTFFQAAFNIAMRLVKSLSPVPDPVLVQIE
jgi:hypothetical protein